MAQTYIAAQGDEIDLICFNYYGRTQGTVEAVLEANRDIADLMPLLPEGTRVVLPDIASLNPATPSAVRLWS